MMSGSQASKRLNFKVNEKDYEVIPFVCENHISLFDRIIIKNRVFKSSMIYFVLVPFLFSTKYSHIRENRGRRS